MKKYLLSEQGIFYKANLHCHSTISDGKLTVEELKKLYSDHGYSIVAFTDHEVFIPHNELTDDKFLALNAYEMAITNDAPKDSMDSRTCHMCFISLDKNRTEQSIFYNCTMYIKNKDIVKHDPSRDFITREYTPEFINSVIAQGKEDGFFITYNHPVWSLESKDEYCAYHGMHALEIVNYSSLCGGYDDRTPMVYDEMLRGGERIGCIATDDNHNRAEIDSPHFDSFGGFTMIKADELTYEAVSEALIKGNYYASEAPYINELYYEDGMIHIKTSDASRIFYATGIRRCKASIANEDEPINEASFPVKAKDVYFRLSVFDKSGKCAYTRAYFIDELGLDIE